MTQHLPPALSLDDRQKPGSVAVFTGSALGSSEVLVDAVVDSTHEQRARMAEPADAFVALPGGVGTLEEFFEAWTWGRLGTQTMPVALLDAAGCWTGLVAVLNEMVERGFLAQRHLNPLIVPKTG
ncbi:LOG family protein [Streptomyces sp. DW26H14]|uniref:LOG family protein n=1 Tax=Streptomyces sp. DW26H14 TaxID=3435395 RepID=UPI00403DA7AB